MAVRQHDPIEIPLQDLVDVASGLAPIRVSTTRPMSSRPTRKLGSLQTP